jgi:endonuclease/exonuclease/phosphatase (EEP) superfamily protein YafD
LDGSTGPSPTKPARRRRAWPWALALTTLAWPLAYALGRHDWRADLASHFRYPAAAWTLAVAATLARRHRRLASGVAVLALAEAWPLVGLLGPNPVRPAPDARDRLKILSANVLEENPDYDRLAGWIRRERPDVVALVEMTWDWERGLDSLRRDYPYRADLPIGTSGIALWSRRPLKGWRFERPYPGGGYCLWADAELGGRPVRIWVVHPLSPIHRVGQAGFPDLIALGRRIGRDGGSRVVVGDLNTTDGSPLFGDFLAATGLRDGRLGFGPQPSWPTWSPFRITIDHSFVSGDLAVVSRKLGPDIGSDHLPFLLELAPAAASRTESASASQSSD